MNNYRKAMSYAYKLDSTNYKDLVHSAYLAHYDRNNGENLFDRHEGYVMRAIRWMRDNEYHAHQYEFRGQKFTRSFETYSEETLLDNNSPDVILENKEIYENLLQQINVFKTKAVPYNLGIVEQREQLLKILTYKVAGYRQYEISEILGVTPSYVSFLMKRLKSLI